MMNAVVEAVKNTRSVASKILASYSQRSGTSDNTAIEVFEENLLAINFWEKKGFRRIDSISESDRTIIILKKSCI